jgi:UDP-N-acetylmuramate dehydrogenase
LSVAYEELKRIFKDNYAENVSLKDYTSFRTGGSAEVVLFVSDEKEMIEGMVFVRRNNIPYYVFGNCSNILISDRGLKGVVFIMSQRFSGYRVDGDIIEADSGIKLSALSRIAHDNSLSGLEFALGIPGTLGGAVAINAGAYDGQMSDVVIETKYIDENSDIKYIYGADHCFGYRKSFFCNCGKYILSSKMKLKKGVKEEIGKLMKEFTIKRNDRQPLDFPSAGSVFKRPPGHYAGKLIQDTGLMGFRIGGAEVSNLHAGFILNKGSASSSDIYLLVKHIQNEVQKKFGVLLEPEIRMFGEFD